jgi:hypothetical protein
MFHYPIGFSSYLINGLRFIFHTLAILNIEDKLDQHLYKIGLYKFVISRDNA